MTVQLERVQYDDKTVRDFLWATLLWGTVGMAIGVIIAIQLVQYAEEARAPTSIAPVASRAAAQIEFKGGAPDERLKETNAQRYFLRFDLEDSLHLEAPSIIQTWQSQGIAVYLVSGDREPAVAAVGAMCGVPREHLRHSATPADKEAIVRELASRGHNVMMVGDGVNDAAALAASTVGVAVSGGVDLALSSADVFLGRPGLAPVARLLSFGRYAVTSLHIILTLSVLYNAIAVTLAVSGVLHPLVAAVIMPAASLSVIIVSSFRRGDAIWKSYSSSCPLPQLSPAEHS